VSPESQAVFLNAVPLLALAAAYLVMTVLVTLPLWRQRRHLTAADLAIAALIPCLAVVAAGRGVEALVDRRPEGNVWLFCIGLGLLALPALLFFVRGRDRGLDQLAGWVRAQEAEQEVTLRGRELDAVTSLSDALARTHDPAAAGRQLLDAVATLLNVEFSAIALVGEDGTEATGLVARGLEEDFDWWRTLRLDLLNEPSGIAAAYFEAAPVQVYDCEASPLVSPRLVEAVGAKSGAFVPLVVEERVVGVLVVATTGDRRAFSNEELKLMQALATEAALALERTRSASMLDQALSRERLVAEISRQVRAVHDLDDLTRIAVTETGRALQASRCFVRLGEAGAPMRMRAEWFDQGLKPIGSATEDLPVANLAVRERRTVAVEDIAEAIELDDETLGSRRPLEALDTRSALATPVIVFDELIGVLGLHRPQPGPWDSSEIELAEAVARELGLALHTARLLEENRRRLGEQSGLLAASHVVTSELEFEVVIQRLVDEVAHLLRCEAADCYLLDTERNVLRCAAVHGPLEGLVGFEFPVDRGLAGTAIATGRSALSNAYEGVAEAVPHPAYSGFASAIVAPMTWSGETRGVLGVGTREPDRNFSESDAELLEAFASLASVALRNAESFEERSRQAQVQRAFYRIAAVLGEPISLGETLNAVAQAAAEALGGVATVVLMPSAGDFWLAGSHELPEVLASFLDGGFDPAGPLPSCARGRRVLAAPALGGDERFDRDWQQVVESGYRALLAVPVEAPRGDDAGLVVVFFAEERHFTDDDLELARTLAGAARGALERSELFEAERSARALAQQLARTGTLLATELDPAAVLDEVVQQAPELLDADACAIRLLEGDELVVRAASGGDTAEIVGSRAPSTAWVAGDVVQSRAPVAVSDASDEPRLQRSDPLLAIGYAALLAVPLVGPEGAMHGTLAVYSRRPRAWREEEIEALAALAGNSSAALSSAELYQRVALERERSVAILANVADGIVAVDREGKVVLWNDAAERITGVPTAEALGRTPLQVLQRNLESGSDVPIGDRLVSIRRGADDVWLSLTEAIMLDPADAVAGRIFAFRDISAERVVEQMKSSFVSAVSEQLRRPLTSIYGFAETLLRQDVLFGEEERSTFLGYIASESQRLANIVDALLNVARLDTGDLQVQIAPTDVRPVLSEVVTSAEQTLPVNGHRFVVDLPDEPLTAEADRDKLRQIVANLVENAVKFSPEGGTVTVSACRKEDSVEVRVIDEGIGIPETEQERIFAKFYRSESLARQTGGGGTGLGLFIAQGLVTAMGGRIWVDSREGQGSSFVFELPVAWQPALAERE
jgi:PAS domain S-box-containing protein